MFARPRVSAKKRELELFVCHSVRGYLRLGISVSPLRYWFCVLFSAIPGWFRERAIAWISEIFLSEISGHKTRDEIGFSTFFSAIQEWFLKRTMAMDFTSMLVTDISAHNEIRNCLFPILFLAISGWESHFRHSGIAFVFFSPPPQDGFSNWQS
jgi:hypothetical protein